MICRGPTFSKRHKPIKRFKGLNRKTDQTKVFKLSLEDMNLHMQQKAKLHGPFLHSVVRSHQDAKAHLQST